MNDSGQSFVATVAAELAAAPAFDRASAAGARARIDDILRPPGALARLDEVATWVAGWHGTARPRIEAPAVLVFAGDHGVAAEGVSAFPAEVTAEMLAAFNHGVASVSAMAKVAGASVQAIDCGVGAPTGNLRVEPAMTARRCIESFETGRTAVRTRAADLVVVGEMGIANTTAAAALATALLPVGRRDGLVGPGTGVADQALSTKHTVVAEAVARVGADRSPFALLCELGGTEIVAMAGAYFEARVRGLPVLLDGYIASTAALALHALTSHAAATTASGNDAIEHLWAGHRSAEPGHDHVLAHLGLVPLLDLTMRLGEASGAVAAIPLVQMACALTTEVATFTEWAAANAE